MLLAVGPRLAGINANDGSLLVDGETRNVAPRDLTFRFSDGQQIDPRTLNGIVITRSGLDGSFGDGADVIVTPGFIGLGEADNEVVVRFAETLPDDDYRIDIVGEGEQALRNLLGDAFNDGNDRQIDFELDLGAQVIAVVPQPITGSSGALTQARDTILVYFNNDDLNPSLVRDTDFYQLIFTNDTVTNTDDVVFTPLRVDYNSTTDVAELQFGEDIDELSAGPGTYRLRIGSEEVLPSQPATTVLSTDAGSSFDTSFVLGTLGREGRVIEAEIEPQVYTLNFPGGLDEPGHRDIPTELQTHLLADSDTSPGITTMPYNFKSAYGFDPNGNVLFNFITETQKQRARQAFELWGAHLGVQFIETATDGVTVATGDVRAINPAAQTGPGGIFGLTGPALDPATGLLVPTAIMDAAEAWDDGFGRTDDVNKISWFETAMHEIGHLLGLGHTNELAPPTIMNENFDLIFDNPVEGAFPGNHDIAHGQHLFRPESKDIDLYRFTVTSTGLFSAETIAERMTDSSLLDSVLNLYRRNADGTSQLIARNDDYFSEDAFIRMQLEPGTYFVGISASGNNDYDPSIEDSGLGGVTQGPYELRLNFRPEVTRTILDSTGTAFDGDADGNPGGIYNFWFRAQSPENTIVVDKSGPNGTGSLASPMNNIARALAAADEGDVVRIVGNGGSDGDVNTLDDNLPYEIGFDGLGRPLRDGATMKLPRGVTVMVDAGAVFKMRRAAIEVGSSAPTVDRSGAGLQVLGTPTTSVHFTSFNDDQIGVDGNPLPVSAAKGDWGGLIFRNDLDRAEDRFEYELEGIFVNYVNHADVRYGGGSVVIDSVEQIVTPIQMTRSRPTVSFNHITLSADAAMSATPDSFEESNFHAPEFQSELFTSDYDRVGPDVHGNTLLDNTINGLFVSISTPAGNQLRPMTVSGRMDDTDVVHVISENLEIQGTPGGPRGVPNFADPSLPIPDQYELRARLDASLVIDPGIVTKLDGAGIRVGLGAQLAAEGVDGGNVIFTSLLDDRYGAGGTFDSSNNESADLPNEGDWTGIYIGHAGTGSIDHGVLAYGGGVSTIEGSFAGFNVIEVHQAEARITNSLIENSLSGSLGQAPFERFDFGSNAPGAIFIRHAQPIIVNNIIRNTTGPADEVAPAISVDPNGLSSRLLRDYGRLTGNVNRIDDFRANQGPLIRQNTLENNKTNGMVVRGATLTTQSVWDDTDITHVVVDTIYVPDFHTFGGMRLESSPTESLVVKLGSADAGFTATGTPLDIIDRIGGGIQIVGQPGRPVILTSLDDNTVGAGFRPDGSAGADTKNERLPERTEPLGTYRIIPQFSPAMTANPDAVASIMRAISVWEAIIQDDVTIVVDFDFAATGQAAGLTAAEFVPLGYDAVRNLIISDAGPHESIVNELPTFGELNTVLPEDMLNPYTVLGTMEITRANAQALGLNPQTLPSTPSAYDPNLNLDGTITVDAALDVPGADLFEIALHELGHVMGFNSAVDSVDSGTRQVTLSALDMFRIAPGTGQDDFTAAPRVLDPEFDQVFYDGGFFDPVGIPILGLERGDIPFSTGETNGDGFQAAHWKDDTNALGISIGLLDPTEANDFQDSVTLTTADKRAFDLIGWDVVGSGYPGGWRSIEIDEFANDRNVAVVVEQESADATAPGTNATPATAQFVGELAPSEVAGDGTRRLGFEVHGFISQPGDLDVYSFRADAGTEVWLDIDRTSPFLDSVVELIDANGSVLARSDNSPAEEAGLQLMDPTRGETPFGLGTGMSQNPFIPGDGWTTNVHDAGMRLNLPGAAGTTSVYHVRVRSSSDSLNNITGGLTTGVYQLQIRVGELDEIPGTGVQFAEVRYATNGIEIFGQPAHSPLIGDVAEVESVDDPPADRNDVFQNAQEIGNVLSTERGSISIAGTLDGDPVFDDPFVPDVDWYRMELDWTHVQSVYDLTSLVIDVDYADGLAGPDTSIFVYNEDGVLVLVSHDSNITDDLPQPLGGSDQEDTTRGSFGTRDPFLGSLDLPTGTYYLAISSRLSVPVDLGQFRQTNPFNPLVRLEPVDSVIRIVEDHIEFTGGSTAEPPVVPNFVSQTFGVQMPSGLDVRDGDTVTVVNFAGDSVTYELDSDGHVNAPNVPVLYFPTATDPLLGLPTEIAIASQLAAAVGSSGPTGVMAFAGGDQVVFQDTASPDLNVAYVGASPNSNITVSSPGVVPFNLSDVTLYVSQDGGLVGMDMASLVTVDPFTGLLETTVGSIGPQLGDIAMRVEVPQAIQHFPPVLQGDLFAFSLGGLMPDDTNTGNYLQIDSFDAAVTILNDDGVETYDIDPNWMPQMPADPPPPPDMPEAPEVPPAALAGGMAAPLGGGGAVGGPGGGGGAGGIQGQGVGMPYNAITFLDPLFAPANAEFGLAVGARDASAFDPAGLMGTLAETLPVPFLASADDNLNVLYLFDRNTGVATSSMEGDRDTGQFFNEFADPAMPPNFQTMVDPSMTFPTPGTNIRERGVLDTSAGGGPGGLITGMTTIEGIIYAVTDTGGLFTIDAAPPTFFMAALTFVGMVNDPSGAPVGFAGLTAGPPTVEGGRFAQTLFGIDADGALHAFDIAANSLPVFPGGLSSVQTEAASPTGLAFSTLDRNLWHVTGQRFEDPGHGLEVPVTLSRERTEDGGSSLHFGITTDPTAVPPPVNPNDPNPPFERNSYDFPGGAYGSIVSNTFSLEDYSAEDLPVLYFNYFLDTEGIDYDPRSVPLTPMRDSFRVFISDDSTPARRGQWHLLATNNSFRDPRLLDEFDDPNLADDISIDVQELFDNTDSWRQARVELSDFAGSDRLRIRFDFSSAGEMSLGNGNGFFANGQQGEELRALPASELRDGQTITVDGSVFEFDLGFNLVAPSGQQIVDGELLLIEGANGTTVPF